MATTLPDQLPGESAMQYYLRAGLSPSDASAALNQSISGNGNVDPKTFAQQYIDTNNATGTTDWYGNDTSAGGSGPYARKVITPNPPDMSNGGWVGTTWQPGSFFSGASPSGGAGIVGSATQPAPATTTPQATTTPKATTSYPAINPGEDSMAYMLRIGMSQQDASSALAYSKAHPGMSFQDVMSSYKTGTTTTPTTISGTTYNPGPTATGPTGIINSGSQPTGQPYYYAPTQQGNLNTGNLYTTGQGSGTGATGTANPGEGMWNGNTQPAVGVPGQPGYQPGGPIAPNIVQTTNFANPNPSYNPNYNPSNPNSTPDNPMNLPDINPQTGQVQQTGATAGTVQGQLSNILTNGSPLLEAARARAIQAANARGLQNSSMAAQAGEEALVNTALPIAQADANTFQNQNLVNQNIVNQFLSQKQGAQLNLQAAYQAFKQNNYAFDKNAQLQTYISDSNISNQQKIAALQGAISQANVATQLQGQLTATGMTLSSQQAMTLAGFTQQNAMALLQSGTTNLNNYANLITNIEGSQLEPQAKLNLINTITAFYAGVPLGGATINLSALTSNSGSTGVSNSGATGGAQPNNTGIIDNGG
jgi:hypothetical protein